MNLQVTRRLLAGFSLVALIAIVVGCSTPSSSLSPTGPTAVVASSAAAAVSFSPNPDSDTPPPCDPTKELCEPPPPPPGTPCSPGYWKNHETEFAAACTAAAALPGDQFTTCAQLDTALRCKGSDASCGRHDAAAALNAITGCTESD